MPDTTLAAGTVPAPAPKRHTWTITRRLIAAWFRDRGQFARPMVPRTCPICGYHGIFISVGKPSRWDVRCLDCGSRERHRLLHLWVIEGGGNKFAGKRILHFAPEKTVVRMMRGNPLYETADLRQKGATHQVDISKVALPDADAAMRELFRLLVPGGTALLTVPLNPTRRETYENPAIVEKPLRSVHFGNEDHKRFYGLDFADRLAAAGFRVETFRRPPAEEARFGLLRDEWIYVATKPT